MKTVQDIVFCFLFHVHQKGRKSIAVRHDPSLKIGDTKLNETCD